MTSPSSFGSTPRHPYLVFTDKKMFRWPWTKGAEEDVIRAKMIEHDEQVGALLKSSKTWVSRQHHRHLFTDNGVETMLLARWRMGPFRGEKGTS